MNWFFIALLAPAIWAATNHIDKYLLQKYFKNGGEGALFIFSALIGIVVAPIILFIHPEALQHSPQGSLLIAINGSLYIIGLMPYVYALKRGDASITIPLFQLIPVFSFFLAWLVLGETITVTQLIGGVIVVIGSIALSFELDNIKKIIFNAHIFWLMTLSSFILSLNFLFFKVFALQASLLTTAFWEYVGFMLTAVCLFMFVKTYRQQFLVVLKENTVPSIALNGLNEILNLAGKFIFSFVSLLVPITLVWFVVGFQPFFVLIYGILLTVLFPRIIKEKISRGHLLHRFLTILFMLIGTYLLAT